MHKQMLNFLLSIKLFQVQADFLAYALSAHMSYKMASFDINKWKFFLQTLGILTKMTEDYFLKFKKLLNEYQLF